jgi:hypothetical protein
MGFVAKLGILDGYVTGNTNEKVCTNYKYTNSAKDFWKKKIQNLDKTLGKFEVVQTNIENISEDFAVILNPFGEEYPEINIKNKTAFNVIKNFIEDGGIYVNTAGFPFFYAWNVLEGKEYPLSEETVVIPKSIQIKDGVPTGEMQMQTLLKFTGTLLFKEFDAIPAPVSKPRIDVYQNPEDIEKFGNLVDKLAQITEFRGMPKSTKDCIPILRAKDEIVEEVYPISALKRGNGYLVIAGMDTSEDKEADLFARALNNFCAWFSKQL